MADRDDEIAELRRLLKEARDHARRGSPVEEFIKRHRDEALDIGHGWGSLDTLLDDYQLHADTGTPLTEALPDDIRP